LLSCDGNLERAYGNRPAVAERAALGAPGAIWDVLAGSGQKEAAGGRTGPFRRKGGQQDKRPCAPR